MRIGKGLVIGNPPVYRQGLSGHMSTRQDKNQQSSQQPQTRNKPNRVMPTRPHLLPNWAKPKPILRNISENIEKYFLKRFRIMFW